jgi:RNA polymerase sigma-70 factor, ECF subfamily
MDGMTLVQHQTERTDEMLASAAQAGDRDSFAILIARYREIALAYAFACLGNRDEAEDAAQEAFVRAYLSLAQFRVSQVWGAWLMRILRNHCTDLKRRKRTTETPLWDMELPSDLPSPETSTLNHERRNRIAGAICRLPEKYRVPIAMHYLSRRTYREIALALGLPESTITGRLAVGLRKLRQTLSEDEL